MALLLGLGVALRTLVRKLSASDELAADQRQVHVHRRQGCGDILYAVPS